MVVTTQELSERDPYFVQAGVVNGYVYKKRSNEVTANSRTLFAHYLSNAMRNPLQWRVHKPTYAVQCRNQRKCFWTTKTYLSMITHLGGGTYTVIILIKTANGQNYRQI